jgi:hypothetical protein
MLVDGTIALATGYYFWPANGGHARLGPWALVVGAVGIDPHSLLMKLIFLVFGVAWLVHAGFVAADRRNPVATVLLAILTLWYLPFGTLVAIVELCAVAFRKKASPT